MRVGSANFDYRLKSLRGITALCARRNTGKAFTDETVLY